MTKHMLKYEIGHITGDTFCVIATLTMLPKSEMRLNKIIENTDRLLDFGFISKFFRSNNHPRRYGSTTGISRQSNHN